MATRSKRKPRKATRKLAAVAAPKRNAAPAAGPVTLTEARALVQAERPPQTMRAVEKEAAPRPSAATVGAERQRLDRQRKQEIVQRVRDYKATMAIMKKRGARRPQPKGAPKGAPKGPEVEPSAAPSFAPLQVLAEGDSWFDYPVPFFGGGIIPRLESRLGVPILNLAKAGDEVRYMLGVEERELIAQHLTAGCPAGGSWDVVLFSGGGNDIVDNPMALWIRDWDPARPVVDHINQPRFDAALALVRAGYEDLIALRDALSPETQLVFQAYDLAIPDGRGICHLGPWLKPTFDLRGFPTQAAAFDVVKEMLRQFASLLTALSAAPRVTFINGQGTLPQQKSSWHNELHPSRSGFDRFADLFHATLRTLFPNRVV
jgi:hypothetical protein